MAPKSIIFAQVCAPVSSTLAQTSFCEFDIFADLKRVGVSGSAKSSVLQLSFSTQMNSRALNNSTWRIFFNSLNKQKLNSMIVHVFLAFPSFGVLPSRPTNCQLYPFRSCFRRFYCRRFSPTPIQLSAISEAKYDISLQMYTHINVKN
jgi:hypothetical protein